jgi:ankyrin repeat protein
MFSIQNSNMEIAEQLLQHGANVNMKDVDGFSVLSIAVDRRDVKMCKTILKYQPSIDVLF